VLALNQLQILLLTASSQLKEIRESAGLPATATHGQVLEIMRTFRDMPRGELGDKSMTKPTALQFVLVEHLAQSAMWQLNEIWRVLGLPVEISHVALMDILRDMLRGEQVVQSAPIDKVIPATEGGQ
jgi:RNA-binding protein YlmH